MEDSIVELFRGSNHQTKTPSMAASSSSVAAVRSWRTAFLTLRDETLTSSPSIPQLVQSLIFCHSHSSFISAVPDLPAHEVSFSDPNFTSFLVFLFFFMVNLFKFKFQVTSDILFLVQLAANASQFQQDLISIFTNTCHLVCLFQSLLTLILFIVYGEKVTQCFTVCPRSMTSVVKFLSI